MIDRIIIPCFTVAREQGDDFTSFAPFEGGFLSCRDVSLTLENTTFYRQMVNAQFADSTYYLVEHAASFCAANGVQSCLISGNQENWDLSRESHRVAEQAGHKPQSVLGRSDGRIWTGCKAPERRRVSTCQYYLLKEEVSFEDEDGSQITLTPPRDIEAIHVSCAAQGFLESCTFSAVNGIFPLEMRWAVLGSRSIAVVRHWNSESLLHALGDAIGDLIGNARLLADISIQLQYNYHAATIGAAKRVLAPTLPAPD